MANWISSKLKVAETFLQQIDQQAADSLGKSDKPRSDEPNLDTPAKSGGIVPLKDQLKKKTQENNDYVGKFSSDTNLISLINQDREKEIVNIPKPSPKPENTLTDSDWTELLSTPNKPTTSVPNRGNGLSGIQGLRKNGGRQGSWGSNLSVAEIKRNQRSNNGVSKSGRRLDGGLGSKLNGKPSDGEESGSSDSVGRTSDSMGRTSTVDLHSDGKYSEAKELGLPDTGTEQVVKPKDEENKENGRHFDSKDLSLEDVSRLINKNPSLETVSPAGKVDGLSDIKIGADDVHNLFKSTIKGKNGSNQAFPGSISDDLKRGSSSGSDGGSDSDTDSGSTSDSENEREREKRRQRREKILAEKAAARAVEAIKERENMVARLEGEKQSLEKILEERAKQQAQEASELQTTMMETMEAVDLEKQKHNNTRMEAFARLAKLETANADLARSLATAQWNLEVEINKVAELRQQIELKEIAREELRRRIFSTHQTGTSLNQLAASKGVEIEREILEAEYSFITDKIGRLQDKEKKLETDIEMTRKEIEDSTEVEIELKRRLGQLTDHLIQKQAQVESLSSEKATLLFRIEAVSRLLEENNFSGTSSRDLESGAWEFSNSKLRPMFEDRIRSGRKHLGSLVGQLDAIFLAGAVFIRRNSAAKLWSLVYLVCLHFWVIYILMSHSQPSNELRSGAVISLENINNTAGA